MSITLTGASDATALASAAGRVPVRGPDGRLLGHFDPLPVFELSDAELERRANDPNTKWVPAAEVEARLRSLDGNT